VDYYTALDYFCTEEKKIGMGKVVKKSQGKSAQDCFSFSFGYFIILKKHFSSSVSWEE